MGPLRSSEEVFDAPVSRLDFAGLLAALHELLGVELDIAIYLPEASFTAGMRARLLRVVELPPDQEAVTLLFEDGEAVTLAPQDVLIYCGRLERGGTATRWIEAQLRRGPCVLLEEVSAGG